MGQVARVPPEASLSRTDDRRILLLALGAAGVTLAVVLGIIGIPAVSTCSADPRGVVTCLRDMADRRFDLPGTIPGQSAVAPEAVVQHAEPAAIADPQPAEPASPEPPAVVANVQEAAPLPPAASTAETAPAEGPAADPLVAVEMAASPETPAVPPAEPLPEARDEAVLTWSAPPPEDLDPQPAAQPATALEPAAAVTPAGALQPGATPQAPEGATARPPPSEPALVGAVPPVPATHSTFDVANAEPVESQAPPPAVAAPLVLAPTIDAIELEGAASFVSGTGPAGALMRLYADGELVGESPVEEGRWLVEGRNLLDSPRRELRVEAIEPETGKLLGHASITVEIELPDGGAPPDERPAETPNQGSGVVPPAQLDPTSPVATTDPAPQPRPSIPSADVPPLADNEPPSAIVIPPVDEPELVIEPEPPTEPEPKPVQPWTAIVPRGESTSVEILAPSELQPTELPAPPHGAADPATLALPPPDEPALIAEFDVPEPQPPEPPGQPVTILRLLPFGDPDEGRYNVGKAIIRRGDTLWSIARRYYGHGIHYRTIFHANRDLIRRPSRIFPGQIFELPLVTDD